MKKINVLVVDDDPLSILLMLLTLKGYSEILVVEASSGNEAINLSRNMEFHLIFMDVSMPVMGGIKTSEIIKKNPKYQQTPIIFTTGFNAIDVLSEDTDKYVGYLQKPYSKKDVKRIIEKFFKDQL